jgi:FtsZ-binding cell division protein ZapB
MSIVTSDGKLKTDVKDLKEALSIVKSLKGKTYNWSSEFQKKTGVDNGRHIGFIAQEIREVLPELVIEDENRQLGVNYTELIPVLVEAIKEQQNQIDALKSGNKVSSIASSSNVDIDAMNKEMNQLKSENQMFKEKFELLEKSISLLCESGCAGLEKAKQNVEDVDALYQSIPNPTDNEALINFYLSKKYNNVSIQINSLEGKSMETIMLDGSQGKGSVKIQLGHYAAQTYFYSLIVDNKVVDTKKLTVIR